jgi:hypothetical protein
VTDLPDTDTGANPARGEVSLRVGGVPLTLAVTFGRLARLSRMAGTDDMATLCARLIGFEPWAVACAIKALAIDPAGPEAAEAAALRALGAISTADEPEWRDKILFALTAHMDAGKRKRGPVATLVDEVRAVEDALMAKAAAAGSPVGEDPTGKL